MYTVLLGSEFDLIDSSLNFAVQWTFKCNENIMQIQNYEWNKSEGVAGTSEKKILY